MRAELDAASRRLVDRWLDGAASAVRQSWVEALEWQRDPSGQRDFLARMERYLAEGPAGPEHG